MTRIEQLPCKIFNFGLDWRSGLLEKLRHLKAVDTLQKHVYNQILTDQAVLTLQTLILFN